MTPKVQNAGQKPAATKYVPTTFTAPGQKPIVISFKKGSNLGVDAKEYQINQPASIKIDEAHYKELLKMDKNHDKKIDEKDVEAFKKSGVPKGYTVDSHTGITSEYNKDHRLSVFLPGAAAHNRHDTNEY